MKKGLVKTELKKLSMADYIYSNFLKGALTDARIEIELKFAERAAEAIFDGSLDVLSKPLVVCQRYGDYCYDAEAVTTIYCQLGIVDFVAKMISKLECIAIDEMIDKVTQESYLQRELLIRIVAAIELCNPRFLAGNLGVIREKELHELLVSSGIMNYVRVALEP